MAEVTNNGETMTGQRYLVDVGADELQALYHGMEFTMKNLKENKDLIVSELGQRVFDTMHAFNKKLMGELIPTS